MNGGPMAAPGSRLLGRAWRLFRAEIKVAADEAELADIMAEVIRDH